MRQRSNKAMTPLDKTYWYLRQMKYLDEVIAREQEQIDNLRSQAASIGSHSEGERVQSSGAKDRMAEIVTRVADVVRKKEEDRCRQLKIKADIEEAINKIPENGEKLILMMHYIDGMSFSLIAEKIKVSEPTVYRLHKNAVKSLCNILHPQTKVDSK